MAALQGGHERSGEGATEAEMPTAFARHIEKLMKASPAFEEGPTSAAEAAFQQRAYPAEAISVAQMDGAASAFASAKGGRSPGKGRPGSWVSVGPSEALYPGTPLLTSSLYVPNRYVAGGRTTSIAISDTCQPGDCKVWVTPAGGGVWRTKNALTGQPNWEYLGGPLGINAAGAVYLDPNDPTDNTVYVGTGEANICGSGCVAGAGVYKSTDGGNTWTKLGDGSFDGLGVGAIVVKPDVPGTIYVGTTTALRGMSSVCCSGVTRPVPGAGQWGLYKSTDGGANWTFIHNGSADATNCTGDLTEFNNARRLLAARRPRGGARPDRSGHRLRGLVRARHLALQRRGRDLDADPAVAQFRPDHDASDDRRHDAPQREHADVRLRGQQRHARARLERSDDVATGAPVCTNLTSTSTADPGWAWDNLCTGQCWYDLFVYTPKGYPDIVYVGGSYSYGQSRSPTSAESSSRTTPA